MFIFSLPKHAYELFCREVPIEIQLNGRERKIQLIPKPGQNYAVSWTDEDGPQEREILDCYESGSLVMFNCDDGPESKDQTYTIVKPSV